MSEATTAEKTGRNLTAFQNNILSVLAEEPRYGLAVKRALESYYDAEVNHGRLYPNLDTLVTEGLVEKNELDKRTNEYALTEAGEEAVLDNLKWTLGKFTTDHQRTSRVQDIVDEQLNE